MFHYSLEKSTSETADFQRFMRYFTPDFPLNPLPSREGGGSDAAYLRRVQAPFLTVIITQPRSSKPEWSSGVIV